MSQNDVNSPAVGPAYEIRRSNIHGTGVFAARDLRKGERILEYLGERISKEESERRGLALMEKAQHDGGAAVYIFTLDDEWDLDGDQPDNDARLINHSCEPNCDAWNYDNRLFIEARRAIKKGEELGFNYGSSLPMWHAQVCWIHCRPRGMAEAAPGHDGQAAGCQCGAREEVKKSGGGK